jgi:hypothetical protein
MEELEAAMASFPAERSLDWRGPDARGGARLSPAAASAVPPQLERSRTLPPPEAGPPAAGDEPAESGQYWGEVAQIAGPQAAACVQRWLMRFVEDLSMDEIELLAGPGATSSASQ